MCTLFLWKGSPPRIKFTRLTRLKLRGGIGLPDLHKYFLASRLSRLVDWNVHESGKVWVTLEKSFSQIPLRSLPWILPKHWPQRIVGHPLILASLGAFRRSIKISSISSIPGPLTPLRGNPKFTPGLSPSFLNQAWPHDRILAYQFYTGKIPRSYENLVDLSPLHSFPLWTYRQIRHFLSTQGTTPTWTRQLTSFEELCTRAPPLRHLISYIYNELIDDTTCPADPARTAWEKDLQMTFTEEDWTCIYEYVHKGSL